MVGLAGWTTALAKIDNASSAITVRVRSRTPGLRAGAAAIALSFSCDLGADTDARVGTATAVGADDGVGRRVEVDGAISATRWVAPLALVVDEDGGTAERRSTPVGLDDNPSPRENLLWLLFFPGSGVAGAVASEEDAEAALPVGEAFGDK